MSLPEYSICSVSEGGAIKHGVKWRGKFDPIAVCDDHRDARRICDALNATFSTGPDLSVVPPEFITYSNKPNASTRNPGWAWIRTEQQLPDDDIEVLVCTKSEKIYRAVHNDGKWYVADQAIGQRLSASCITHWCHPVYPNQ